MTYATQADCEALIPGLTVTDAPAFALVLEEAERAIDGLLGPWLARSDTGLKFDPTLLPDWASSAIRRAVAAQVEWTILHERTELAGKVTAPVASVKGPEFEQTFAVSLTTAGQAPAAIGPAAARALLPIRPYLSRWVRASA